MADKAKIITNECFLYLRKNCGVTNPIFDKKQEWCWSSDKCSPGGAWHVNFNYGYVNWLDLRSYYYVRVVRS